MSVRYPGSGEGARESATATPAVRHALEPADLARPSRLPMHTPPPMVAKPERAPLRLACLAASPGIAALVREVLALAYPGADVTTASAPTPLPQAHAAIVDATTDPLSAIAVVRELRAFGFAGGVVLLRDERAAPDATLAALAARLGVGAIVAPADAPRRLGAAIAATLPDPTLDADSARAWAALRRTQQLVAAGEMAAQLQHALANPLTALLAEAQLMEMEPMPGELREGLRRIIEQCRRTIEVSRRLEGIGGK